MKKCLYLIAILTLLLQPAISFLPRVAAQEGGDEPHSPTDQIFYVSPGGSGTCTTSWANACELQTALGATVSGDEIWVQAGTYKPTTGADRTVSFALKSGVAIYGGFAGTEISREQRDWAANKTTLSGDIGTLGDNSDNSNHVVTGSGVDVTATLDGFTITGGNANSPAPRHSGGGMYNNTSSPSLANVTFSGNTAVYGGGMYNDNHSNPTLANVTFSGNTAIYDGGGMGNYNSSNPTLTNVAFSGNMAEYGGGMFNNGSGPTLTNVTFSDNTTAYDGGGMYNNYYSSPKLANVTFSGNMASYGGGMYNYNNSNPTLANVTFSGNAASYGGGMRNNISSPALVNVTFSGNTADLSGGGMFNYNNSNPRLANVTFSGNTASYGGGMRNVDSSPTLSNVTFSGNIASYGGGMNNSSSSSPALENTILWGNTPNQIFNNSSTPVITYSDIQGGHTGTGNINLDPQFVRSPSPGPDSTWGTPDDDYGDLRLQLASPVIDAGNNAAVPAGVTTDLLGYSRYVDIASVPNTGNGTPPIVDMGAYEAQIVVYLPVVKK